MQSEQPTPIYLLPGMARDYPVFSRLAPMLPGATAVKYVEPRQRESIATYAARLAESFSSENFFAGVSFGGIVAQEISRVLEPLGCIVISSITHPQQLPPWFRVARLLGGRRSRSLLGAAGSIASCVPHFCRPRSMRRLAKLHRIQSGAPGSWHQWATGALIDWSPPAQHLTCPLIHIHGDADTTFPIRYPSPDITVSGGLHALPISHPQETARAIIDFVKSPFAPRK